MENKNLVILLGIMFLIFWFSFYRLNTNVNDYDSDLRELRQEIDSVSTHFSKKIIQYERETYILDSIIKLSNEDYEEDIEHYWDSINANTTDSSFNSELSDFLEDLGERGRKLLYDRD